MERSKLSEIVQEQYNTLLALPDGIRREKLDAVLNVIHLPHVIAITGIRRSGKSTLMQQALKQAFNYQVYYLDFEDERLIDFNVNDFNLLYEIFIELYGERNVFIFDEIQIVDQWESYVRRMYKAGNKFIITGSSAELLSSELSTKLTGRHISIELLPFSFREYLSFVENEIDLTKPFLTKERGLLKNSFNTYMRCGGIPEYLQYNNSIIIKSIYENILYKDVIVRYEIKSVKAIRELSLWLCSNPGALISYTKLKDSLKLGSINTVKNFIHYLENAYLIFTISKFSYSIGEQTSAQRKVYIVDTGLMEHISFQFSNNTGKYLENIVYLELRRRGEFEIYYYKTANDLEVDFVLRKGKKINYLIQVCENLSNPKTREREIRALCAAMDELKLNDAMIITSDTSETIQIENKVIKVVSILNWILE